MKINNFLQNNISIRKERIWELDLLRGFLLILVTWDHIGIFGYCWEIIGASNVFGHWLRDFMFTYLASGIRYGFQPVLIWLLVLLSGINCTFSRNHTRRATDMVALTFVVLLGHTILKNYIDVLQGDTIFNILTIFSICFSLWILIEHFRIKTIYLVEVGIVFVLFGLYFYLKYRGGLFGGQLTLPKNLEWLFFSVYNTNAEIISHNNFEPLFPSIGFFLLGAAFGRSVYSNKRSLMSSRSPKWLKPVTWTGRHSLSVFLFGAPILVVLLWLLSLIRVL